MQRYYIIDREIDADDPAISVMLSRAYLARNLPEPAHDEALGLLLKTPEVTHVVWRPGDALPGVAAGSTPAPVQRPVGTLQ